MRAIHFTFSLLLVLFSACLFPAAHAGDVEKKDDKDKPKEQPFKYSAWCAFSDLMRDRPYINPDAPIDIVTEQSRPGMEKLGGFGRRGQWAHIVVDLKNTTDPEKKIVYEGDAEITLNHTKPDNKDIIVYGSNYRQPFQVAPQSEKTYHFSVFCPEEGWHQSIQLHLQTSNGRNVYRDLIIHDLDEAHEELIVVVSDQPGAFKFLGPPPKNPNDVDAFEKDSREPLGRQVASVTPSELPARWHDLTIASLIIIDGPPTGGLSPDQWDAIKAYAQAGGKVLIMAGKDPARLKGPVEDLAGIVVRSSAELASLDQFTWPFPAASEKNKELRVPIIEVTAPGAGIVKRNSKTQIVEYSAKSYGAGLVAFIPFSLSDKLLEHWPDRSLIPLNLIRSERNLFAYDPQDENDTDTTNLQTGPYYPYSQQQKIRQPGLAALRNSLDTSFATDTPVIAQPPRNVALFLLLYLACAVPLNYFIFTLLRRREAAWLLSPLWALGFTIGAHFYGYSGHTGVVIVNEVSVIEAGPGQGTGVGRTFLGLYAPQRDDYQIVFPGQSISSTEIYDNEAAPGHLLNTEFLNRQDSDLDKPMMRLRENGQNIMIESILVLQRSTRRFEIQHRAALNGGLDLRFTTPGSDQASQPAIKIQNNTGRTLFSPIFIKGGQYLDIAAAGSLTEFGAGQSFDSSTSYSNWHGVDDRLVERLTERYTHDSNSKHTADRVRTLVTYLRSHMKQYAAGVFVAWAEGGSLPVQVSEAGAKPEKPDLDGITLLVVPAQATNRGGRSISVKKNPPRALFATAYSPEDRASGEWKPTERTAIPIRTPDDVNKKCVYLRLQFDREYAQYVYENKAAQLTFTIANKGGRRGSIFSGELNVSARLDAATQKSDRFKLIISEPVSGLQLGQIQKIKSLKFQFADAEIFRDSAIVLKIQPEADEGTTLPDNMTLENVELKLVDK